MAVDTRPLTHAEVCQLFNQFVDEGGARIRWSEEAQGYVTTAGDRYPSGTVEDVVRGLTMPEKENDK